MEHTTQEYGSLTKVPAFLLIVLIALSIIAISTLYMLGSDTTTNDTGITVVSEDATQTPGGNTVTHLVVETPDGSRYQCLTTNGPGGMTCDWENPLNADITQSR